MKVKITDVTEPSVKKTEANELQVGTFFLYDDQLWIMEEDSYGLNIGTGAESEFYDERVEPVDVEIRYRRM